MFLSEVQYFFEFQTRNTPENTLNLFIFHVLKRTHQKYPDLNSPIRPVHQNL